MMDLDRVDLAAATWARRTAGNSPSLQRIKMRRRRRSAGGPEEGEGEVGQVKSDFAPDRWRFAAAAAFPPFVPEKERDGVKMKRSICGIRSSRRVWVTLSPRRPLPQPEIGL